MESFRGNTNGERYGRTPEENPATAMAYRRASSQSQQQPSHQLQPENHRAVDEQRIRFPSGADLQTLESSFGSLSVLDSSVRHQQQNPLLDNRWSNRSSSPALHNHAITNDGGGGGGGNGYFSPRLPPPSVNRDTDLFNNSPQMVMNQYSQRISYENDCVNGGGSYGYEANGGRSNGVMLNNGFNSGDVPYLSRNRFLNQIPLDHNNSGFGYGINSSWRNVNSHDPRGSIFWLAKDRTGSVQLQGDIDGGSKEKIDMIFNDVIFQICDLMVDPFGHHVAQKLMDKCSSQQITQILDKVTQDQYQFVNICNDPLGTRAVQSLMRCLHSEEQIGRMVEIISIVALLLTRSNNAKHVILQCFNQFSPSQNMNLLEGIAQNCYRIAIDQNGCCMLQQCLGIGCNPLKQRLIHEIISNALRLCLNCYGNYVVQYVVELEDPPVTLDLVRQLSGNYAYLSRNKYGSHAVQKLLKIKYIDSSYIINDLLREIDTLLLDPFGNYVIQTALFVAKENVRDLLKWHIERNKRLMRCNKFGTKILEKFNL